MTARRVAVISAGLSDPSSTRLLADRMTRELGSALTMREIELQSETFELRDYARPIMDRLTNGFASRELEQLLERVTSADALIAVTPIFSTSYSGLFKTFVDILDRDGLQDMPVLLGATAGTARHSLAIDYAMRPLFTYLHAKPVSTGVFAASSDWGEHADHVAPLDARIRRGAEELADSLVDSERTTAEDPFDPDTYLGAGRSFSDLLG